MTCGRVWLFALQMTEFHLRLCGDAGHSAGEADAMSVGEGVGSLAICAVQVTDI